MDENALVELQQAVSMCLKEIISLKEENAKIYSALTNMQAKIYCGLDNVKYEANDPRLKEELIYPKFYSIDETLRRILDGASMARFGDGEFSVMTGRIRQRFQDPDERLARRLYEIIKSNEKDFLIGIADNYGMLNKFNNDGRWGIRYYMSEDIRAEHKALIDENRTYHNAYISRPYALFADNNTDAPAKRFEALKQIWNDRNVIFVEGEKTRMGVGNDLFDNAKSIRRILCPPVGAYDKYDDILAASKKAANEKDLFLIALGATACVLAYDLYKSGGAGA